MRIEKYKAGDEEKILELFELCFNQKMTLEYWNWRFKDNPFLKDDVNPIFLMWEDDQLIGHYAVSPIEMEVDGVVHKTALSMTTMTHPDFGGKGVFSKLASELYKYLEEEKNYSLIWGFPNNNSHYGFVKRLEWKDIVTLPTYSVNAKIVSDYGKDKDIKIASTVKKVTVENSSLIKINKTEAYYNWRYNTNPSAQYFQVVDDELNNSIVYKVYGSGTVKQIDILEKNIQTKDPIAFLSLLKAVLKKEPDAQQFNLWLNYYHQDILFYEKSGFRLQGMNTYLSCRPTVINQVLDFKKWDIDFIYSDVY